ncbi:ECF transporter S component [Olsenella sp. An188]|uniref:ECF transporter S component n=1 Tax=Olsenella sp. An188 TaxID=1965579 RepID=UPI000B38B1A4|nr:ECF transporter S component [Olsenella sp. An188]OUP37908.1 ECF transporter S component [Olsenella sp. An188]
MSGEKRGGGGLKSQFTTKSLVLIPIAVGINLVGGTLCSMLKLPLFLDTIGTLIVATLSGPWVAALTGLITNVFLAIVANPVNLPYAVVSVLVGLTAGYLAKAGLFNKIWGVVVIWLAVTLVNSVSASLITTFVFGGATGINGTSVLTAALIVAMQDVLVSVLSSSFIESLIDKGISVLIAYLIWRKIPRRFISQYASDGADDDDDDVDDVDDEA